MENSQISANLSRILEHVKLKEGVQGLINVLAIIDRYPYLSIQKLSRESKLPIPICVAIRNEFQKINWCLRDSSGTKITEQGQSVLLSFRKINQDFGCDCCEGMGLSFPFTRYKSELEILSKYSALRGKPKTIIDQSFATAETSLSRVLFMNTKFDLFQKNYAFMGDSDLTSIALALFTSKNTRITVFDIDENLERILSKANQDLNLNIQFVKHDLRQSIPNKYKNQFDCILTDPPYTINGCLLFMSRGMSLLKEEGSSTIYLSFSSKTPNELSIIQKSILDMGGVITDIIYNFNKYIGAQKIGGVSNLIRILTIPPLKPPIKNDFSEPIYTGEINPKIKIYSCLSCTTEVEVGKNQIYQTIEELKKNGCPHCKDSKFRKISEKIIE